MALGVFVSGLAGVLTWTFAEYVIHRCLGHDARLRPNAFESEHTRHHAEGDYFAPASKKGAAAVLALAAVSLPAMYALGTAMGLAYGVGLAGMYVTYEVIHRRAHTHAGFGAYGRWVRRHHFWHHFGNPRCNHGVTSPLWDLVFGTYHRAERVVVPHKLVMPWLVDPATGDIRGEFAEQYVIRGRARPNADAVRAG